MDTSKRQGGRKRPERFLFIIDMVEFFTVLTDLTVILFDIGIYIIVVPLRKENRAYRTARTAGCLLIPSCYALAAYVLKWPVSIATAVCMSIPSFLLFLALTRYRDSRFVLSFCLIDTVSLIVAFAGRCIGMFFPQLTWLSFLVVAGLFSAIVLPGRGFFKTFRKVLDVGQAGWGAMAAATIFIYFAMIFFLAYPKPLAERPEYALTWLVFAAVVCACYVVFLQSVMKTKRILEQNQRLEREKVVYRMAYTDSLTGLGNRAAWMERISALEREEDPERLCCVVFDCDRFKQINDTFGHHAGDEALRSVAQALTAAFPEGTVFRLGGDEFAVLLSGLAEDAVESRLEQFRDDLRRRGAAAGVPLSVTAGYAFSIAGERLENTYIRADQQMYQKKPRA